MTPFRVRVLAVVAAIPEGRVLTYGQVAALIGQPRTARQVGMVLRGLRAREAEVVPWFRIINASGGLSTYKIGAGEVQRALLESEGVVFDPEGRCELARYSYFEVLASASGATLNAASGGVVGS